MNDPINLDQMLIDSVDSLDEAAAKYMLKGIACKYRDLITKLDELSADDFFGTEGWRKFMDLED